MNIEQFFVDVLLSIFFIMVIGLICLFSLLKPIIRKRKLICLVGPSGSGKTTLQQNLLKENPFDYEEIISCTTRNPRDGESNGKDYHFIGEGKSIEEKQSEFEKMIKNDEFIETAKVGDNYYGTPVKEFYKSDKNIVHVLDPYGAYNIKNNKKLNENFEILLVFMDIKKETILKYTQDEERLKRDEKDNIHERFKEKGLKADYTVTDLTKTLHNEVHDWITYR